MSHSISRTEITRVMNITRTKSSYVGPNQGLRSTEFQEMIQKKPDFLSRWALLIFFFITAMLLAGTLLIKYPDTLEIKTKIFAAIAPAELTAAQNGKLIKLFVSDGETVTKGQIIAWTEATADYSQVIALSFILDKTIDAFGTNNWQRMADELINQHFTRLGLLQPSYETLISKLQQKKGPNKKNLFLNTPTGINTVRQTPASQKTSIAAKITELKYNVANWIRTFSIQSPAEGKIAFTIPLRENFYLKTGQTIGFVNASINSYSAQAIVQVTNVNEVEKGQTVHFFFDDYPNKEFGFIKAEVSQVTEILSDSSLVITIGFPGGLVTNYQKRIQYTEAITSHALIFTKDKTLFSRIYNSIKKPFQ